MLRGIRGADRARDDVEQRVTVRAMASEFDGGNNYREETKAAAYNPSAMPQPGRRVREPRRRAPGPRKPMHPNADWAGVVPPETKRKMVAAKAAQAVCFCRLLPRWLSFLMSYEPNVCSSCAVSPVLFMTALLHA